jgi:hypothetical protein
MSLCAVVTGNPADGFQTIGTFKQETYAVDWASTWLPDDDWWIVPILSIEGFQNVSSQDQVLRSE